MSMVYCKDGEPPNCRPDLAHGGYSHLVCQIPSHTLPLLPSPTQCSALGSASRWAQMSRDGPIWPSSARICFGTRLSHLGLKQSNRFGPIQHLRQQPPSISNILKYPGKPYSLTAKGGGGSTPFSLSP